MLQQAALPAAPAQGGNGPKGDGMTKVAMIGFGEVGGIFARGLRQAGVAGIAAFDIAPAARARAGADARDTAAEAAVGADVVFVAVTAGSALAAARSLAGALSHAPLVVDVNSVSPATKQRAAAAVTEAGGRYVEAAVMTSVPPKGIASPMLLGGPHAADFIAWGTPFGMMLTKFSDQIGGASSVKMCRSIMIKGLEALSTECMLTARHYGVEQQVLASLKDTLPHEDWELLARYMIGRALQHGRRRAEEVREVAATVQDAGVDPVMSTAIAKRQDWAADMGLALGRDGIAEPELGRLLDAVLGELRRPHAAD